MGFFARFSCLRRDGTASDLAQTVRDLLKTRHVVEVADLAAADLAQFATRHWPLESWQAVPSAPLARYSRQVCPAAFLKAGRSV